MRRGTVALSWGKWGGFYRFHGQATKRICVGFVALTFVADVEIDDLMEAYADQLEGGA